MRSLPSHDSLCRDARDLVPRSSHDGHTHVHRRPHGHDVRCADRGRHRSRDRAAAGDGVGRHLGNVEWEALRIGKAASFYAAGAEHAQRAGSPVVAASLNGGYLDSIVHGPLPRAQIEKEVERVGVLQPGMSSVPGALFVHAMRGEIDRAWELVDDARHAHRERGNPVVAARLAQDYWFVAVHGGREAEAVPLLESSAADLEQLGEHGFVSTTRMHLATALEHLGRIAEAERQVARARELSAEGDVVDEGGLTA